MVERGAGPNKLADDPVMPEVSSGNQRRPVVDTSDEFRACACGEERFERRKVAPDCHDGNCIIALFVQEAWISAGGDEGAGGVALPPECSHVKWSAAISVGGVKGVTVLDEATDIVHRAAGCRLMET